MINNHKNIFLILIFLCSAGFIFFRYALIPKYLAVDEVEFTKLALSLEGKPYTPYSTLATGHSTLYFYLLLLSLKLFGISPFALRFVSAISGILCGLLFFGILQLIFKNKHISFLGSFVLITSRWFINFARFSFEPTFLLFLELSGIYFLLRYLRDKKIYELIISSIFAGLVYNSYTPGRIFFFLSLFFLIYIFRQKKYFLKVILYFLLPFLIIVTPLQTYLFTHEDIRVNQLFFPSNPRLSIQQKTDFFTQNITKTVGMFIAKGDHNGKHNYPYKPALNPLLGIFSIAGLLIAIKSLYEFKNVFFLGYLIISLIPTLLVYPWENPSMLRTYTVLPSIAYFSILPFITVIRSKFSKKTLLLFTMLVLIVMSTLYELRTYFFYQADVFNQSFEIKKPLQYVINCPNVIECKD